MAIATGYRSPCPSHTSCGELKDGDAIHLIRCAPQRVGTGRWLVEALGNRTSTKHRALNGVWNVALDSCVSLIGSGLMLPRLSHVGIDRLLLRTAWR